MGASVKSELSEHRSAMVIAPACGGLFNVLGDHQRHILTGKDTNGACLMLEQVNAPGTSVPLHYHTREDEIFHVIEGQVRFTSDGETVIAGPGTTVNLPRGTRHRFEVAGETEARVLLTVIPAGIENMFRELAQLATAGGPPDIEEVVRISGKYGVFLA